MLRVVPRKLVIILMGDILLEDEELMLEDIEQVGEIRLAIVILTYEIEGDEFVDLAQQLLTGLHLDLLGLHTMQVRPPLSFLGRQRVVDDVTLLTIAPPNRDGTHARHEQHTG
jgi:hypothetical protein